MKRSPGGRSPGRWALSGSRGEKAIRDRTRGPPGERCGRAPDHDVTITSRQVTRYRLGDKARATPGLGVEDHGVPPPATTSGGRRAGPPTRKTSGRNAPPRPTPSLQRTSARCRCRCYVTHATLVVANRRSAFLIGPGSHLWGAERPGSFYGLVDVAATMVRSRVTSTRSHTASWGCSLWPELERRNAEAQ